MLLIEAYALLQGQTERLEDPMFYYALIFALVYFTSTYFLFTLEGKPIRRRAFSWAQSFIFHYCLFLGAAIFLYRSDEKLDVLVLLSPEFVVGTLSLIGFFVSRKDLRVSHA